MKHKSETFGIFQKFKSIVDNDFSKSIKTLRTDNGGGIIKTNLMHIYISMILNIQRLILKHLNKMG